MCAETCTLYLWLLYANASLPSRCVDDRIRRIDSVFCTLPQSLIRLPTRGSLTPPEAVNDNGRCRVPAAYCTLHIDIILPDSSIYGDARLNIPRRSCLACNSSTLTLAMQPPTGMLPVIWTLSACAMTSSDAIWLNLSDAALLPSTSPDACEIMPFRDMILTMIPEDTTILTADATCHLPGSVVCHQRLHAHHRTSSA